MTNTNACQHCAEMGNNELQKIIKSGRVREKWRLSTSPNGRRQAPVMVTGAVIGAAIFHPRKKGML